MSVEFFSAFEVPDIARDMVGTIVTADEIALVEAAQSSEFSAAEARAALDAYTGAKWSPSAVDELVSSAYRRGVLELADESLASYRVGTFYGRLSVFVVSQPDEYLALPPETRAALDAWCFNSYVTSLGDEPRPTGDRVLSLDETLDVIDAVDRQIWLNRCDCRTLAGECDKPTDTCVTFKNGINTLSHRGWSKPLTKDEAKAVVVRANRAGLMQTVNDNGICNCCSDCCYLFRAEAMRGSVQLWPAAEKLAALDEDACIGCGACIKRCPFDAFVLDGDRVVHHPELCRGCGLCVDVCTSSAISMVPLAETTLSAGIASTDPRTDARSLKDPQR